MLAGERQGGAIAGAEELVLALVAAAPHRADRVDDVARLEPVAAGDLGRADVAAAERLAFLFQLRARCTVDGAVDAAAAEQAAVGGIHDGRDVERGDVGDAHLEPRRADLGAEQGRGGHASYLSAIARAAYPPYGVAATPPARLRPSRPCRSCWCAR